MNFYNGIADYPRNQKVVLSVGKFSSLHLGHQRVIRRTVTLARECTLAGEKTRSLLVLVFSAEQMRFFPFELCCQIFESMRVDDVVVFRLKDIVHMTYQDFLSHLLEKIQLRMIVASDKLSIGYKKQGTCEKIMDFLSERQAEVGKNEQKTKIMKFPSMVFAEVVDEWTNYEEFSQLSQKKGSSEAFDTNELHDFLQDFVSSSILMHFIQKGYVQKARKFTFLPFMLQGKVVHGRGNGKKYGFPTANFSYPEDIVVCKSASYATLAVIKGQCYQAMSYIGLINGKRFVETYLFNFQGSLYNDELKVFLLSHLRDDQKPRDVRHLTELLNADAKACRSFFGALTEKKHENEYSFSFFRLLKRLVALGFLREAEVVPFEIS